MKAVTIYSDGACEGNPGPGGWAAVLIYGEQRKEICGAEPATTNNRMEIRAALEALRMLRVRCKVDLHTDSKYLQEGVSSWVHGWKRRGWKTKGKTPVKNEDLWRAIDEIASQHEVTWHWVKGHAGNLENEKCDTLAVNEIKKLKTQLTKAELAGALEKFKAGNQVSSTERPITPLELGLNETILIEKAI